MTTQSTAASTTMSAASPRLPSLSATAMTSATSSTSTATKTVASPVGVSVPSEMTRNGPSSSNGSVARSVMRISPGSRSSSRKARAPTALVVALITSPACTTWTAVAISSVAASTGGRIPFWARSATLVAVSMPASSAVSISSARSRARSRMPPTTSTNATARRRDDQHARAQRESAGTTGPWARSVTTPPVGSPGRARSGTCWRRTGRRASCAGSRRTPRRGWCPGRRGRPRRRAGSPPSNGSHRRRA